MFVAILGDKKTFGPQYSLARILDWALTVIYGLRWEALPSLQK